MDNYQKEFIIYSVYHVNDAELFDKLYETACEVASILDEEAPVNTVDYLESCCESLKPIEIAGQFYEINPYDDGCEYMIYSGGTWEGMTLGSVKDWANDMLDDNLGFCETKDISIWNEERFHEFMWNRHCKGDREFMMSYYKDYDIYPYSSDRLIMLKQFVQRWVVGMNEREMLLFDDVLSMGHMFSIKLINATWDEVNIVQSHTVEPSLIDVLKALPKYGSGTFAEYCHDKGHELDSKSWKLYSREKKGWEATMKLFPDEQARRELAAIF